MAALTNGFKTIITLDADPNIQLYEKRVTPPSIDMGGKIDTTTMRNSSLRTGAPKSLVGLGDLQAVCAFNPAVYQEFYDIAGVIDNTTVTFPDGAELQFWSFADKLTFNEMVEDEQPTATAVFCLPNTDPNGDEDVIVFVPAP